MKVVLKKLDLNLYNFQYLKCLEMTRRKSAMSKNKGIDLTGQRFGRLKNS